MGALVLASRSFDERQREADHETLTSTAEHRPYYRRLALLRHLTPYLLPVRPGRKTMLQDGGDWLETAREKRRQLLETKPIDGVSPNLSLACGIYRASLKNIAFQCRRRGLDLVFITQPTIYRKDLPDKLQRLLWMNNSIGAFSMTALEQMANAFNQTMIDVCQEEGLDC